MRALMITLLTLLPTLTHALYLNVMPQRRMILFTFDGVMDSVTPGERPSRAQKDDVDDAKFLLAQFKHVRPYVIFVNILGGSQVAAEKMATLLMDVSEVHSNKTKAPLQVVVSGKCYSACTLLMTKLTHRADPTKLRISVGPDAEFALHAPRLLDTRKRTWLERSARNRAQFEAETERVVNEYLASGLNPNWTESLRREELTRFGARQVCQGSGIVPADSCADSQEALRARLLGAISKN